MSKFNILGTRERSRLVPLLLLTLMLSVTVVKAQIVIGGSVYGGGNQGDVDGNSTVTLRGGDLNAVYGGARMANVGGRAFVNIDGAHASSYILANYVYGGNDISGNIGTFKDLPGDSLSLDDNATLVDNTWNAFVRITSSNTEDATVQKGKVYIGQLFGGGNGNYDYEHAKVLDSNGDPTEENNPYYQKNKPELDKTYLEIKGGSIVYGYGGGNNATVRKKTVIYVDNPSTVVNSILDANNPNADTETGELLTDARIAAMGYNPGYTYPTSDAFQIGSLFGGNNTAEMTIRPTWNLKRGKIRNLYSGGNRGDMVSEDGLYLPILEGSTIDVDNVYGGCRMANVIPRDGNGNEKDRAITISRDDFGNTLYFPDDGYSARIRIKGGGHINNVYGGNDITGRVKGGCAIGIYTTVYGNIYGSGNGSYPYTDNPKLKDDPTYGDLYYDPSTAASSVEALNAFRPNAEQVSILVTGEDDHPEKPTTIHGSIYCGGNSASLSTTSTITNPKVELKIGPYVIADNVFLGNNGEHMVEFNEKEKDGSVVIKHEGVLRTMKSMTIASDGTKFNSMNLEDSETFRKYMDGVSMPMIPQVVFANGDPTTYVDYTSYIGSIFCGGNVGSMKIEGKKTSIDFNKKIIVFNKVVGGCNNANVDKTDYNAAYEGGYIGTPETGTGDKLELNFSGLKIQPKRWIVQRDADYNILYFSKDYPEGSVDSTKGERKYVPDASGNYLEWNTFDASTGKQTKPVTTGGGIESEGDDLNRRFDGGHIYGGCYNSGIINGNVKINISESIVDLDGDYAIFDKVAQDTQGEAKLNGHDSFDIIERRSGVIRAQQGMDVLGSALNVFGGGYGEGSEVWGSVTINMNKGYVFQVFGGGEKGTIGKKDENGEYNYDAKYSTTINLKGSVAGQPIGRDKDADKLENAKNMAEAEFIYGGGFEGLIAGNTRINLGNGRVFDTFAGSCNADILGHTETYIGYDDGLPYVRDDVYGGNDLGGNIFGRSQKSFKDRLPVGTLSKVYGYSESNTSPEQLTASAYIEYIQGRVDTIFGGCYGYYDYKDKYYAKYTYTTGGEGTTEANIGHPRPGFTKPRLDNAFIYFRPDNTTYEYNKVLKIHGAGQGYPGEVGKDSMQHRSYVLIDIPQTLATTFQDMEVFGAGAYGGLGMGVTPSLLVDHTEGETLVKGQPDKASAIIDLIQGQINAVYGGSYQQGVTRRTVVNVPDGSTIELNNIFGGAYGYETNDVPCDVYEAIVNYNSSDAVVKQAVYGGNNSYRRTLYGTVNIHKPVYSNEAKTKRANVYGAGYGKDTWSQYTEVNLFDGAEVKYVYGGGNAGMVLCKTSVDQWKAQESSLYTDLGAGYTDNGLENALARGNRLHSWDNSKPEKYNTNVHIYQGAYVHDQARDNGIVGTDGGYAYAGGEGTDATVSGTTYIDVLGGIVMKDLYAGGYGGAVKDKYGINGNTDKLARATAYIEGGKVRKVYGGGYQGHVGKHENDDNTRQDRIVAGSTGNDILADAYVVIGIRADQENKPEDLGYAHGVPTVEFNAYGGGEGGSVFGTAHLTLNNGFIGYRYYETEGAIEDPTIPYDAAPYGAGYYQEKLNDETWTGGGINRLKDCGNVFGAGYDDLSTCDFTHVEIYGGKIRNSLFGGGEIATVGRGATKQTTGVKRDLDWIWKQGRSHIEMYNGHVLRNVFGGGKGYNELKYGEGNRLFTDGYVFGQTEVFIRGGEVGTVEGAKDETKNYGNVFGGGDIGYVYGNGKKSTDPTGSPDHYYYYDDAAAKHLTEDCKVVVSPYLQTKTDLTINGHVYKKWDYVRTEDLNTIAATKDAEGNWSGIWKENLFTGDAEGEEERGITIHNAVFAGGNVLSNNDDMATYAMSPTVFGNTTATLFDVYHRDFISVGTEHIGGLYGGGNLSVVDGYRELNITNYGTDYYGLDEKISYEKYQALSSRERAYFQLQYECLQDVVIDGKPYKTGDKVTEEEYNAFDEAYKNDIYWKQYGFCSIYAGRLLNTIQRADLCGVFGSRMVLQGARDRVATQYNGEVFTINRVGELSLNEQKSMVSGETTGDNAVHGNYFGIYSVVNRLGHLTSDVRLDESYQTIEVNEETGKEYTKIHEGTSFWAWKTSPTTPVKERNIGTCLNQVALASGVYLELTTEASTESKKVYGDITGVVELDLINVRKDISMGGGYVYARNEHGKRSEVSHVNVLLSEYNKSTDSHDEARTYKFYEYDDGERSEFETSGNFIHRRKRIVDDCYPNNGVYNDYDKSPAHYWYIKGDVYVYDQTVSAYVGSASAYAKEVKIPLTITAASNGKLKLLNVQPSRYAYFSDYDNRVETKKIPEDGVKVDNETTTFYLNDVISWWDWQLLTKDEQKLFVKETYVNVDTCYVDGTLYPAGTYVLENDPSIHNNNTTQTAYYQFINGTHTFKDKQGADMTEASGKSLFRSSNNISHDTGYVLTLDMDTPPDWDDWYTKIDDNNDKKNKKDYGDLSIADRSDYKEGPTFRTSQSGLYGQMEYAVGDLISSEVYQEYTTSTQGQTLASQAEVAKAYMAVGSTDILPESEVTPSDDNRAMLCTSSIQFGTEEYLLQGEVVRYSDVASLAQKYMDYNNRLVNVDNIVLEEATTEVLSHLSAAYICTTAGPYGGQYFKEGQNYSAISSWCSLPDDRDKFTYNYDAFDVLIDPNYTADPLLYHSPYSDEKSVEYTAVNTGTAPISYFYEGEDEATATAKTVAGGGSITREEYERIKNDKRHYTRIEVAADPENHGQTIYVAKTNFFDKGTPYAKGQDISLEDYNSLDDEHRNTTYVTSKFISNTTDDKITVYYCWDSYGDVAEGDYITPAQYNLLKNYQEKFSIQGMEPTETTMLYVSRESTAKDVTKEKIISVVYQYTYYDEDSDGEGVSLINELHVVNIHLQLESGVPEIGVLSPPVPVIPGKSPSLKKPDVKPGLYEVLISGWEMYTDKNDAENHRNGEDFVNGSTPVYWYQNQKLWVAFYSKTYLGKTYSNPVLITVANYHDLDAIMANKANHLYVDHPDVDRASKIYIDNRACTSDPDKSKLDLLKDFFDLSIGRNTEGTAGHAPLNDHVRAGNNLEFFLRSDVSPKAYTTWSPISPSDDSGQPCFNGTLHGDGYTISGLDHSLIGKLCGQVYNLGVTGSFTSAGIVDTGEGGYVENCWVKSTATTMDAGVKAVFGNPTATGWKQTVNCYYPETNHYAAGDAHAMPERAFYNGTVAYNLNGFYLNKRKYDKQTGNTMAYQYLKPNSDGTLPTEMSTGYYPTDYAIYPLVGTKQYGYVENRFADGDFVYASGSIPEGLNIRQRTITTGTGVDEESTSYYVPIWPDDYIYFGQMLTYGYDSSYPHEPEPSRITKGGERLATDNSSNRVYRAPAYFGSKAMQPAYYNPMAYFPAYSKPKNDLDTDLMTVYPGMTAIDFAGHDDSDILDDDGLLGITVNGQTQNLLVYAPASDKQKTYNVLTNYFKNEPQYDDYKETSDKYSDGKSYGRVAIAPTSTIAGHIVPSTLVTTCDHFLVDKQDFNAPISYRMGEGKRMWYQRRPTNYVSKESGTSTGWEDISLPFSAELVSTQQKGEITHFFEGSTSGHEYWLRELRSITGGDPDDLGDFKYPLKDMSADTKPFSNKFLWDYYYSENSRSNSLDDNSDQYQQNYYNTSHDYDYYPRSVADKPYLIGFPGTYYYEFDLSGGVNGFQPLNTSQSIDKLDQQMITFASKPSEEGDMVTIGVSDDQVTGQSVTHRGYLYKANYSTKEFSTDEINSGRYLLSASGNKYNKLTADMTKVEKTALPFRAYFEKVSTASPTRGSVSDDSARGIVFVDEPSNLKGTAIRDLGVGEDLIVKGGKKKIAVESQLRYTADVRIVTPAGITLKTFTIQPTEYVETRVETAGVYIVEGDEGRYVKKVIVR